MFKFKLTALAVCAFLSLTSSSCSDDDKKTESFGETTGDYFPMAQSNIWHYEDGSATSFVSLGAPTSISGATYFPMTDTSVEIDLEALVAKRGASYFERINDATIPLDNGTSLSMKAYEIIILRDDLEVGQTWAGNPKMDIKLNVAGSSQNIPATLNYVGTILARGETVEIGSMTFTDVIKAKVEINQVTAGQASTIDSEFWFAKGVGIIKSVVTSSAENSTTTKFLYDYTLN